MILQNVNINIFLQDIQKKQIICVGFGQLFHDMLTLWDKSVLEKIILIADNKRKGQHITILRKDLCVESVNNVLNFCQNNMVILITSMYCKSLYDQLNELLYNIDINCYIYPVMSLRAEDYTWLPSNSKHIIPKTIHYFWFGKGDIPDKNKRCIESWEIFCPDYKIIKWTEENYDITKCRYMQEAYEHKKWGFVPDFARLDVLYEFGGIYLDTDVELIKPLDNLLYENSFACFQRNFWINMGLGCGCKQGTILFKKMRDVYFNLRFVHNNTLNLKSSPYYQTLTLLKYGLKCNNTFQKVDELSIFPNDFFDPMGYAHGIPSITKNTYGIHHYHESWVDEEQRKINIKKYTEINFFRNSNIKQGEFENEI